MSKAAKIRALLDRAATPGERAAAKAALARLKQGQDAPAAKVDVRAIIESRTPIEGWEMRVLRRGWDMEAVLASMGVTYRWDPTDDVYFPEPLHLTSGD